MYVRRDKENQRNQSQYCNGSSQGNTSNHKHRDIKKRENNLADDEAKKGALRENSSVIMTFQEAETQNNTPHFSLAEVEAIKKLGATLKKEKWILLNGRKVVPKPLA